MLSKTYSSKKYYSTVQLNENKRIVCYSVNSMLQNSGLVELCYNSADCRIIQLSKICSSGDIDITIPSISKQNCFCCSIFQDTG